MMNVKIKNGILITSILISMVLPVFADNNSIVEMELISDGTLDGTWTENTSLQWAAYDPGDGNYTYTANATYTYAASGTYLVNLTVTDDEGSSTSSWNAITVPPTPSSGFSQTEVNWLLYGAILAVLLCGVFFVLMVWRR